MNAGAAGLAAFAAWLAGTPAAPDAAIERVALAYDLSVSGIDMAEAQIVVQIGRDAYAIDAHVETFGAASMLEDLTVNAASIFQPGHAATLSMPGTALTRELYHAVRAAGDAGKGTQALITAYDRAITQPTGGRP